MNIYIQNNIIVFVENLEDCGFEGSDLEVVDECANEEIDSCLSDESMNMDSEKNSLDEKMEEGEGRNTNEEEISDEITVIKLDDDIKLETTMSQEESQNNSIDFTADVSLEHLNDNDVLEGLNDNENNTADSENYGIESEDMTVDRSSLVKLSSQDDKKNIKLIDETQEIILVGEINKESQKSPEELWYEEKVSLRNCINFLIINLFI